MTDLVDRLAEGQHPVEVSLPVERTVDALRACLDRGYVHIRFTNTRGGTELGVPVDRERSDLSGADLEQGTGRLTLAGELTLDYRKVRCVATIDLPSMVGEGRLEILPEPAATA